MPYDQQNFLHSLNDAIHDLFAGNLLGDDERPAFGKNIINLGLSDDLTGQGEQRSNFFHHDAIDKPFGRILSLFEDHVSLNGKALCIGGPQTISNSLSSICEWTESSHLQDKYIWPEIIRNSCDIDVSVIAHPNPSVEFLCSLAIEAMSLHGLPNHLYVLFPDLSTCWSLSDFGKTESVMWDYEREGYFINSNEDKYKNVGNLYKEQFLYDSKKIKYNCSISQDIAIFNNFISIDMLYNFCKAAGISFRFTFETKISNEIMSQVPYYKDAFAQPFLSDSYNSTQCVRHSPQNVYQNSMWENISGSRTQIGIHNQIHFAEYLMSKNINDKFLSWI